MLTYAEAKEMMSRARDGRRKLANNTYLEIRTPDWQSAPYGEGIDYAVRLHGTDVVTLHPDGSYTLDSGGWQTPTTKERINRFAPVAVWAVKRRWQIAPRREPGAAAFTRAIPYQDGMRVRPGRAGQPFGWTLEPPAPAGR